MAVVVQCVCQCSGALSWTLKIAVFIVNYTSKKIDDGKRHFLKSNNAVALKWHVTYFCVL